MTCELRIERTEGFRLSLRSSDSRDPTCTRPVRAASAPRPTCCAPAPRGSTRRSSTPPRAKRAEEASAAALRASEALTRASFCAPYLVESKSPVRWPGAPTEARVALCDLLRTYTPRWLRSRWAVVA